MIHPSHLFLVSWRYGLRLSSETEDQSEHITNAKDSDPSLGMSAFIRFRRRDAEAGVTRLGASCTRSDEDGPQSDQIQIGTRTG